MGVPEGVKVNIKSRQVTVEGPRGKLYKDLSHLAVCFSTPTKNKILIEMHQGHRRPPYRAHHHQQHDHRRDQGLQVQDEICVRSLSHQRQPGQEQGDWPVGGGDQELLGEKLVRRVTMRPGVEVAASANQKDQIELSGNDLENVSQCAADIQQICRVRNKDIRKFLDGLYVSERGNIMEQV